MIKHMVECKDCHKLVDEKNLVKGLCKNCAVKKVVVTDNTMKDAGIVVLLLAIFGKGIKELFDLWHRKKS